MCEFFEGSGFLVILKIIKGVIIIVMKKMVITLAILFIFATGYFALVYLPNEKGDNVQFRLPDYLVLATTTTLTNAQQEMIYVYDQARGAMLNDPISISSFAPYLSVPVNITWEQISATDHGLGLRLEAASGGAIETHSDYHYLFPPYLSYNDKATILIFRDKTLWLMEHTRSERDGEFIYGYRIYDINFTQEESGSYKILTKNIGENYELQQNDVVREKVEDFDLNSEEESSGALIDSRPIPKTPTFQRHQRFVKSGDVTQKIPVEIEEGVKKVIEHYEEN